MRAYIENKLGETGQLQKLYYIGPQFRRERPQKGRYRQFSQIGAEVIGPPSAGSESPLRDAEILEMLATLLDELGITGWKLELNSVGSAADRARYNEVLRAALIPVASQMCEDCQRRAVTNPLRVLDCKVPADQPIIDALPKISDSLDQDSQKHFAAVLAALDATGVPYTRNHRLVRGLDYYTRTTFEFAATSLTSAQNAVGGGGRYDGLAEAIGGPPSPGIGFGIGIERLLLACDAEGVFPVDPPRPDAFVVDVTGGTEARALCGELRRAGLGAVRAYDGRSLKAQLKQADRSGAGYALIVGPEELGAGVVTARPLRRDGQQVAVPRASVVEWLTTQATTKDTKDDQ